MVGVAMGPLAIATNRAIPLSCKPGHAAGPGSKGRKWRPMAFVWKVRVFRVCARPFASGPDSAGPAAARGGQRAHRQGRADFWERLGRSEPCSICLYRLPPIRWRVRWRGKKYSNNWRPGATALTRGPARSPPMAPDPPGNRERRSFMCARTKGHALLFVVVEAGWRLTGRVIVDYVLAVLGGSLDSPPNAAVFLAKGERMDRRNRILVLGDANALPR